MKMKHYKLYEIESILMFKLINNTMFSETGKQCENNTKHNFLYTYHATHFGIDTTWRMGDAKQRFGFIYNWSANQRNYYTS